MKRYLTLSICGALLALGAMAGAGEAAPRGAIVADVSREILAAPAPLSAPIVLAGSLGIPNVIGWNCTGGTCGITWGSLSSITNTQPYITFNGSSVVINGAGSYGLAFRSASSAVLDRFDAYGNLYIAPESSSNAALQIVAPVITNSSSGAGYLSITGADDLARGAGVEVNFALFNFSQTTQWATGALATERAAYIRAPTLAFVGDSTVTTAATLDVSGAPIAGAHATISNAYALRIESGASIFGGTVTINSGNLNVVTGGIAQVDNILGYGDSNTKLSLLSHYLQWVDGSNWVFKDSAGNTFATITDGGTTGSLTLNNASTTGLFLGDTNWGVIGGAASSHLDFIGYHSGSTRFWRFRSSNAACCTTMAQIDMGTGDIYAPSIRPLTAAANFVIYDSAGNTLATVVDDGTTGHVLAAYLQSNVSTGTAPLVVASTTKVTNLNADTLDGVDSTAFATAASPSFTGQVTITGNADQAQLIVIANATMTGDFIDFKSSGGNKRLIVDPGGSTTGAVWNGGGYIATSVIPVSGSETDYASFAYATGAATRTVGSTTLGRILIRKNLSIDIASSAANGASAVGIKLIASSNLSTAGALNTQWINDGDNTATVILSLDKSGNWVIPNGNTISIGDGTNTLWSCADGGAVGNCTATGTESAVGFIATSGTAPAGSNAYLNYDGTNVIVNGPSAKGFLVSANAVTQLGVIAVAANPTTYTGQVAVAHLANGSGAPTSPTAGTGCGTSSAANVAGGSLSGQIGVTCGTAGTNGNNFVSATFPVAFSSAPRCVISCANAATCAGTVLSQHMANPTTSAIAVSCAGGTCTTGTLLWNYVCVQ